MKRKSNNSDTTVDSGAFHGDLNRQPYHLNVQAMFIVSFMWPNTPGSLERYAGFWMPRKTWREDLAERTAP